MGPHAGDDHPDRAAIDVERMALTVPLTVELGPRTAGAEARAAGSKLDQTKQKG